MRAWWLHIAREDLRCARRAFEAACDVERVRGYAWRRRRAQWLAHACRFLVLAEEARHVARAAVTTTSPR